MFSRPTLAVVASMATLAAVILPAGMASAASYYFTSDYSHFSNGSEKHEIVGYRSDGYYAAVTTLTSDPGGPRQRDLVICDELADGQPVYGLLTLSNGAVVQYKAPGSVDGCFVGHFTIAIRLFALKIGSYQSGWVGPPSIQ